VTKACLIILLCFMTAFAAGICVGVLWQRRTKLPQDGWLSDLNLSSEQREKIRAIWTDPLRLVDKQTRRERREAAQKEREDALRALVTGEQKQRYEEVMSACQRKLEEIAQEARKSSDDAYVRTKAVLTETQRAMFDELRKKREETRGRSRLDSSRKQAAESAVERGASSSATEQKKEGETEQGQ